MKPLPTLAPSASHLDDAPAPDSITARAPGLTPPLLPLFGHGEAAGSRFANDPDDGDDEPPRRRGWARLRHPFILLVVLPTLLAIGFEYLIAADQYESEAQFIVRAPQSSAPASSLGQMLGLSGGSIAADAHSVDAYLLSHDAVDALGAKRLAAIFRRPEADVATRLWDAAPQPETLLKYYRGKVHVSNGTETGITTLTVRAYRPDDAKALADSLLQLGEARVNQLNDRLLRDGLAAASRQVSEAEALVEQTQVRMTAFRQSRRDADPERTSAAQIQLAATLQQQAAQARANFETMAAALPPSAPQYAASARKVAAMERQVATAQARLAGSERSVAGNLGQYEELQVKQQFAAKRYEAAASSLQAAREQLLKQQLFIVPVVKPNLPGKALYPQRLTTIAIIFFGLLFAYAIGWLILAGVREHAE